MGSHMSSVALADVFTDILVQDDVTFAGFEEVDLGADHSLMIETMHTRTGAARRGALHKPFVGSARL